MAEKESAQKEFRALFKRSSEITGRIWFNGADSRGWRKGALIYASTPIEVSKKQAESMAKFAGFTKARIISVADLSRGWEWTRETGWIEVTDLLRASDANQA